MQVGMLLGPALGGLLLAHAEVAWAYAVDVAGLVAATGLFMALRRSPPTDRSTAPSLGAIAAGLRYAVGRKDLLGTYVVDMVAMFMAMPTVLLGGLAPNGGRLAGIEMLSYSVGPLGGQVRAGLVADATTVRMSIVSGGVLCVVGVAATATWLREFWSYDARTDPHEVRERERRTAGVTNPRL